MGPVLPEGHTQPSGPHSPGQSVHVREQFGPKYPETHPVEATLSPTLRSYIHFKSYFLSLLPERKFVFQDASVFQAAAEYRSVWPSISVK